MPDNRKPPSPQTIHHPTEKKPALSPAGEPKGKKLLDQYREALRNRHYSLRTEKTYILWVRSFILFHNKHHPKEMGIPEIRQFIPHLVTEKKISSSTQNQALSAILFLYRPSFAIHLYCRYPL